MSNKSSGYGPTEDLKDRRHRRARNNQHRSGGNLAEVTSIDSPKHFHGFNESDIRQTKLLVSELKRSLSLQEPWSKEVEFQRLNVRHQYMALIFRPCHHSFRDSPRIDHYSRKNYAIEALNLLWLDTSHALINVYRLKLGSIDKAMEENRKASKLNQHPKESFGPVARRKVLQQFRSFLHAEDEFWKSLIHRLVARYRLTAAQHCLRVLKISDVHPLDGHRAGNPAPDPAQPSRQSSEFGVSKQTRADNSVDQGLKKPDAAEGTFLVHKALICFGDLTRYRELYSHPNHTTPSQLSSPNFQPNSSRPPHPSRQSKAIVERDWSRAYECYNQARLLLPNNGNPSNQLAVLSSYLPDVLSSVYHYFLALCVKNPFPTARQNLRMTFTKAVERWSQGGGPDRINNPTPHDLADTPPHARDKLVHLFLTDFVALHGMLYNQVFDLFDQCNSRICAWLGEYLKERALSPELIMKMTVICMAAVWNVRVMNQAGRRQRNSSVVDGPSDSAADTCALAELNTTIHLLQFATSILRVAGSELESISGPVFEGDLSQNISAVLRRILPAMRLISKWVCSDHLDHISRFMKRMGSLDYLGISASDSLQHSAQFFHLEYGRLIRLVEQKFPSALLPAHDEMVILDEDLDLAGFLSIRKGVSRSRPSRKAGPPLNPSMHFNPLLPAKALHPNEEHLMRLADIQRDAKLTRSRHRSSPTQDTVQCEVGSLSHQQSAHRHPGDDSPVTSNGKELTSNGAAPDEPDGSDAEDAYWVDDEDDPVEMAMRAVVAQQMPDDHYDRTDLEELNNGNFVDVTNIVQRDDVDDDDDGGDEVLYFPTSSVDSSSALPHTCDNSVHDAVVPLAPGAVDPVASVQGGNHLKTAADLLASMTKQVSILSGLNPPHPLPQTSDAPVSPTGWSSLAMITQFSALSTWKSTDGTTGKDPVKRNPSISLPKPAEGSSNLNIWSNNPRQSVSSSALLSHFSDRVRASKSANDRKDSFTGQLSPGSGFMVNDQQLDRPTTDWSLPDVKSNHSASGFSPNLHQSPGEQWGRPFA